ncbi:MAG: CapA family protein [Prevotella sp.]|uniref:CapA family protein n=1 Tax=Prevotella sp. TaxID=59823 RepID=UPI002A25F10B|nr:CapA family protein [Prevotella sp.]MDD7318447.1 CapA family protein [Prevotellaceae bacterium]MDY4020202.1 CapA family protein [Prevotella sp.]
MKKFLSTTLLLTMLAMANACNTDVRPESVNRQAENGDSAEFTLSILVAGDLMQHQGQINAASKGDGTYDYEETFRYVKEEVSGADLAIANFEVTLGGRPYKGYPCFSAPDEYLDAAVDAGFDVLLTANNHCLDLRQKGLERTIDMMDKADVMHLGTYKNKEERDVKYPLLVERNGFRVVLLNFTYGTNGLKVQAPNVVNYMDTTEIARDIMKAKTMQPDIIIAIPHWGVEYVLQPNKQQRDIATWLLAKGVDHVIGSHPHVLQPMELLNKETRGGNMVAYSLGNYVSNMTKTNTDGGAMVRLDFRKRGGEVTLEDCGYRLVWVSRPAISGHKNFRIYPVDIPDSMLNGAERTKRNILYNNMKALFDKYNKGVGELK